MINSRYVLHEILGQGGMGVVYRATDRLTDETIALKQVTDTEHLHLTTSYLPAATTEELHQVLAHEFQTLASLRHPNIISVLDYGFTADKKPYFTMNYLPDAPNILEGGIDVPLLQRLSFVQQQLRALVYLQRTTRVVTAR